MKKIASATLTLSLAISGSLIAGTANASTERVATQTVANNVVSASDAKLQKELLDRINTLRAEKGLKPLVVDFKIQKVAEDWTSYSVNRGGFAHNPDFYKQIPAGATYNGEIIGTAENMEAIVFGWEMSEGHLKVITNREASKIGIGVELQNKAPKGEYFGQYYATVIIADYTKPPVAPTPTPTPAPKPPIDVPTPTPKPTPTPTPAPKPPVDVPTPTTPPPAYTPPAKSPFKDVATNNIFYKEISWMADSGISTGWADRTYRPYTSVNRDAMAAFLYRAAGSPAYTPPKKSPFKDVATNHVFYKEIAWMKASGISTGWADGTYRPYTSVNRDSMAAFLYRAAGKPVFTPPAKSQFKDVATNNIFYKEIAWMKASGISTGWANGTYQPYSAVNRDAMAAFLYRSHH